jgi:hypothetical protein
MSYIGGLSLALPMPLLIRNGIVTDVMAPVVS